MLLAGAHGGGDGDGGKDGVWVGGGYKSSAGHSGCSGDLSKKKHIGMTA